MKLNIGCGRDITEGWANLDLYDYDGKTVSHDLNKLPYPFKDNQFDEILCSHIIEHLDPLKHIDILRELHRISRNGSIIKIKVPHFSNVISRSHLTHYKLFGYKTLDVVCDNIEGTEKYLKGFFEEISKEIHFNKLSLICRIFCKFFSEDIYERYLSKIIPATEVEVILRVKKNKKSKEVKNEKTN